MEKRKKNVEVDDRNEDDERDENAPNRTQIKSKKAIRNRCTQYSVQCTCTHTQKKYEMDQAKKK